MDDKKIDSGAISKLTNYDETYLLDNIEHSKYIKKLLYYGAENHDKPILEDKFQKLFRKVKDIKSKGVEVNDTDLWEQAIELEKTLWFAGDAINEMIVNLYELLSSNPKLGYSIDDKYIDDDEY